MRTTLNTRLLAWTMLALAVLLPVVYFWHAYQVSRTADALLTRADSLAAEGKFADAAAYLFQYLQMHPENPGVRVRLAETYDLSRKAVPDKSRAIDLYYQALGVAPDESQPALRRRLAELLLESKRFASAEEEAKKLLASDGKDPQGHRILAMALYGQFHAGSLKATDKRSIGIGTSLEQALQLSPTDIHLAMLLAEVYRNQPQLLSKVKQSLTAEERRQKADRFVDGVVEADKNNAHVYLARYAYRSMYQRTGANGHFGEGEDKLDGDLVKALELGPEDVQVLLAVAAAEIRNAQREARKAGAEQGPASKASRAYQEARQHYEHAIRVASSDERGYLGLGRVYALQNKFDLAIQSWDEGLQNCRKDSILLNSQLAEALIVQGKMDRAGQVLDVLDAATAAYRKQTGPASGSLLGASPDLLRARWLVKKGDYRTAATLLSRVATGPRNAPSGTADAEEAWKAEANQIYHAWILLGGTYAASGQWDQAASAYEQAESLEPQLNPPFRSAQPYSLAASAWMSADRPEMAASHYERAAAIDGRAESWLLLATARFHTQARLPKAQRNWDATDQAMARAKAQDPKATPHLADPWRLRLLEADYLALRSKERGKQEQGLREAAELLRAAEKSTPDSASLMASLVPLYERLGCRADADRTLARHGTLAGQTSVAYLLRARVYSGRKQYDEARKAIREGLSKLAADGRGPLQAGLVQVSLEEGRPEQAYQELQKLVEEAPSNLILVRQLAELAIDLGKFKDAEAVEGTLRALEGEDGSHWRYCRARRLLAEAKGVKEDRFAEADKLQSELRRRRPAWPAGHLLNAQVLERSGELAQATAAYQEAIRLGERRIAVYERVVMLLYQLQRFAELDKYLAQLQDRTAISQNLMSMEILSAVQLRQLDRALDLAREGAKSRPADPLAHVWLGQMLAANKQNVEAEKAFHRAVELGPTDARTYSALVAFYAAAGKPELARDTLQRLAKNFKASDAERALLLAQGYEVIGEPQKAEAAYREAGRLGSDNPAVQQRVAERLLPRDPAEAEKALRRALELDPKSATARRSLAALLAERGGDSEWQEAQQLLEPSAAGADGSHLDRRLQALLLARRGGKENLAKAREMVNKLIADPKTGADGDRLLLAQLYEVEGRLCAEEGKPAAAKDHFQAAEREYLTLVSRADPAASNLAAYVESLLRRNAPAKAAPWMEKLEKSAPDSPAVVGLQVRCLQAQGRTAEIERLLEGFAERLLKQLPKDPKQATPQEAQICLSVGGLYATAKQFTAMERWCRRAFRLAPERYEPLAMSLAQQGRIGEAIELCLEAAKSDKSARPATTLASVLLAGRPSAEDFRRAEPVLAQAARDHKDSAGVLNSLANVRIAQQRIDEACALLRQVLDLQAKNVVALNNLATLLAEQPGKESEALKYIDRAIRIVGQQPGLMDTKGTALVYLGKANEAVECLKTAVLVPEPDPRYYFHLAVAYDRLGEVGKAREELAKARRGELTRRVLTEMDRRLLAELDKKFPR